MITFKFAAEDPADYEFYSDVEHSFKGMDHTVEEVYERFECFLLGLGYQQGSIQRFYNDKFRDERVKESIPVTSVNL